MSTPVRKSARIKTSALRFGVDCYATVDKCFVRDIKRAKKLSVDNISEDKEFVRKSARIKTSTPRFSVDCCATVDKRFVRDTKRAKKLSVDNISEDNEFIAKKQCSVQLKNLTDKDVIELQNKIKTPVKDIKKSVIKVSDVTKVSKKKNNSVRDASEEIITDTPNDLKTTNGVNGDSITGKRNNRANNKIKSTIKSTKRKIFDVKDLESAIKSLHSSSTPDSLPCRESQFNNIFNFVRSNLIEGNGGCMYISGVPGTGKTATVHEVKRKLEKLSDSPPFTFIEINGLRLSEPHQCFVQILLELTGEKRSSYQAEDALNDRFIDCDPNKKFVVLLVDELDLLRTRKQNILYHLFDWPLRPHSKLIVLAIANAMDLPEKLMINRVSSRLGLTRLSFNPYSFKELEKIVSARLTGHEHLFNSDALQLVCRKVAAVSGDARRTLDICRRAVEMAQIDNKNSVSMSEVDSALTEIFSSLKLVRIRNGTEHEKLFLQSIAQEFRISGLEEATFIKVCRHHIDMCTFDGNHIPSTLELAQIANTLASCGLIILEKSNSDFNRRIWLNVSVDDISFALKM